MSHFSSLDCSIISLFSSWTFFFYLVLTLVLTHSIPHLLSFHYFFPIPFSNWSLYSFYSSFFFLTGLQSSVFSLSSASTIATARPIESCPIVLCCSQSRKPPQKRPYPTSKIPGEKGTVNKPLDVPTGTETDNSSILPAPTLRQQQAHLSSKPHKVTLLVVASQKWDKGMQLIIL